MDKTVVRFLVTLLGVAAILIIGWQGGKEVKAQGADWLPVKHVRIGGAFQYISKEKVKKVLLGQIINGFYNVDIQDVQASMLEMPWVKGARVERVWPDTIHITIDEQMPVVRWMEKSLLNIKGEVFKPDGNKDFSYLPLMVGPVGHEIKMLKNLKILSVWLAGQGMELTEFRVNERRAWSITLLNETVINVGRNQHLKRIERFLNTISLITDEHIAKIATVDLRYSNGFALTWKEGEAMIDWTKTANNNKHKAY